VLLDYHSFYGGETPPQPHHGSVVLDWFKEFQRREKEQERERERRRPKPKPRKQVVALSMDAELPAVEVYAFGRVRARLLSLTALKLASAAQAFVHAAATSDVALLPPTMRSDSGVVTRATLDIEVEAPEATGAAELRVLLFAAGSIPDTEAAALAVARISLLAEHDALRPAMLAILREVEPLSMDSENAGWTDDLLLMAAAELLLEDEDDEEE